MSQPAQTTGPVSPEQAALAGRQRQDRDTRLSWRPAWSAQAALRAARATIIVPSLFALTFKVIGDPQMTIFAVFGSFGALVMTAFGGTRRDRAIAHLGLAVAGSATLIIGTLVSGSAWLAAIVTIPVAFAVFFAAIAGPSAAAGVTAALLAYVLPVASAGGASTIGSRLAGWWLASAISTAAVLLTSPRSATERLRPAAAACATALAHQVEAALAGAHTADDRAASLAAKRELMTMFAATPFRPTGLAQRDQGLADVIHLLEWCTGLIGELTDGHLDLRETGREDRDLLAASAAALRAAAALLTGEDADPGLDRVRQARSASAVHLRNLSGDPATVRRLADHAFHAQVIAVASAAAAADALIAARRASPEFAARNQPARLGIPAGAEADGQVARRRPLAGAVGAVAVDASNRSVWFRNSARGAVALAAAVAVAKVTDVQHAFWVVLGTLSVLRTSAAATGSTALRALAGTAAGFVVGGALLVGIGTSPAALWVAFPLAVLVAAYTPGTAPFVVGQAAFTVTVVVLFNLLVPAGWRVGLIRVEDVAIGCAVSLVVGALFWPRGAAAVVGDDLADALRRGAEYLAGAARWALGTVSQPPEGAAAAIAAGTRLEDALRGYLTEPGSGQLTRQDLWVLVMAAMRLRLSAASVSSLPASGEPPREAASAHDGGRSAASVPSGASTAAGPVPRAETPAAAAPHPCGGAVHAALERQAAELAAFYQRVAAQVGRPADGQSPADEIAVPDGMGSQPDEPCYQGAPHFHPEALWVADHLRHLAARAADIPAPALRLARARRRPWWR